MTLEARQVVEADFPEFVELAHTMQQECEPDIELIKPELLVNMFRCINDPDRKWMNIFVVYRNKVLIGMAVADANTYYFSPKIGSTMHYWYVLPQYRGSRAAIELLRLFEKWSRQIGAYRMHFGADREGGNEADVINRMIASEDSPSTASSSIKD